MKTFFKYIITIALTLTFILTNNIQAQNNNLTVLFTHDMHDNLESYLTEIDDKVVLRGGFASLYTQIEHERAIDPELLLIDAGDFSMGTLFQSIFTTHAPALNLMAKMGYDATTFGNHEFDFRASGLADALNSIDDVNKVDIVASNISFDVDNKNESIDKLKQAFEDYPIKDYKIVEKNGIKIGLFGLMGYEADSNAPMAEIKFTDMLEESQRVVNLLQEENVDMIVALSHSGTNSNPKKSEDEILAKEVAGIDLILSGHSHTTLNEPITVNNTTIVSAGRYAQNLGKLILEPNGEYWKVNTYDIIPIDDTITVNATIKDYIEDYKIAVNENYLNKYDLEFNDVIAYAPFNFTPATKLNKEHREEPLGILIGDAYRDSVKQAEGDNHIPIDVAVVPSGVLRDSITQGEINVSDIFNILPLGVGKDTLSGYPLISVYLTEKELRAAAEVDASIQPILSYAQLYMSGLSYTFNPNRIIFNKVTDISLIEDNQKIPLEKDRLYRVVADLYTGQMLNVVNDQSKGILSIVPKDQAGNPIENFEDHIIYDENNNEVKAWIAFSDYLKTLDKVDNIPTIPEKYADSQGYKIVDNDKSIMARFKNPNIISIVIMGGLILLLLIIILLIRFIIRKMRKPKTV